MHPSIGAVIEHAFTVATLELQSPMRPSVGGQQFRRGERFRANFTHIRPLECVLSAYVIVEQMHRIESVAAIGAHKMLHAIVKFAQMLIECVTIGVRFPALMANVVTLARVRLRVLMQ